MLQSRMHKRGNGGGQHQLFVDAVEKNGVLFATITRKKTSGSNGKTKIKNPPLGREEREFSNLDALRKYLRNRTKAGWVTNFRNF